MKASEMTNEELARELLRRVPLDSNNHDDIRVAAARLRKVDDYAEMCANAMREVCAIRAKLKAAEDALNYVMSVAAIEEAWSNTSNALAAIREEMRDPCNARDGEGSSLRIGLEGEKEYCVVAKYRQDLQVKLEDYDYHRVTGPLPLDTAKHWLDYHKRIRTKSEDPKILVREVSKWRLFDQIEEGGAK